MIVDRNLIVAVLYLCLDSHDQESTIIIPFLIANHTLVLCVCACVMCVRVHACVHADVRVCVFHASVHVWIIQGETSTIRREQQLVQVKGREQSMTQQQPRQQVSFSGARQNSTIIYLEGCFEALVL